MVTISGFFVVKEQVMGLSIKDGSHHWFFRNERARGSFVVKGQVMGTILDTRFCCGLPMKATLQIESLTIV